MARTTSQLVSARRPPGCAGPSPRRARRPPGPGEAGRPGGPRAGRRLTCCQAAGPGSAGAVAAPLGRRGEPGPRCGGAGPAGALTDAQRAGEPGRCHRPSRWKCSESLFSARPGDESPGSLRFCPWRNRRGLCRERVRVPPPQQSGSCEFSPEHLMLRASEFAAAMESDVLPSRRGGIGVLLLPGGSAWTQASVWCDTPGRPGSNWPPRGR